MADREQVQDLPTGTIHERMAWIMANVPVIHKTKMQNVGYSAFAIDSLYTQLRHLFGKAQVYILPRLETIDYVSGENKNGNKYTDVRLVMRYVFRAPDGTEDWMMVPGESRDYADKGTFQATQQAIKYGFVQAFMIATGEPDADNRRVEDESQHQQKHQWGEPAPDDKRKHSNAAWHALADLFPDADLAERETIWFQIREKLRIPREHDLTAKEADEVVAAATKIAEGAE